MLYISTSKIHESTVGASFTVSFSVAPDEIGYLTALHEKYAEMNMCGFTIKPSDSEKPNNSTRSKMEQVDKDTNVRSKDCETCKHWEHGAHSHYYCARLEMRQECHYEPKTEPQTCANGCKWLNQDGECTEPNGECHIEYRTEVDEPQTERSE